MNAQRPPVRLLLVTSFLCGFVSAALATPPDAFGAELVNLTIRSDKRDYSYPDAPPAPTRERTFAVPGPGRIRIYYYQSVYYRESVGGGASFYGWPGPRYGTWSWDLGHKNLGRTTEPVKPVDGKPYVMIDILRVDAPVTGLIARLMPVTRSTLAATSGIQYESVQQLIVEFVDGDKDFSPLPATPSAQDVRTPVVEATGLVGTWIISGAGAPGRLEITKEGAAYRARYFGGWNAWETILDFTFDPATGRFAGKRPVRPGATAISQLWEGTLVEGTLRGTSLNPNTRTPTDSWVGKKADSVR